MKVFLVSLLIAASLLGQPEVADRLNSELVMAFQETAANKTGKAQKDKFLLDVDKLKDDVGPPPFPVTPVPLVALPAVAAATPPIVVASVDLPYAAVYPVVAHFGSQYPTPPVDPRIVFLDGLGNSIVELDMSSLTVLSQVVVPSTVGPFGLRPASAGPETEAWVANGAVQVSVVDLSGQRLVTNIPTSSIPSGASAGIVFSKDGATAFEAVRYFSTDSSGNKGALVIFDTATRTVTSTFPLKVGPTAILMAPDGLTLYLLSSTSTLTYYDVLSGTADLTVSTFAPGSNAGYNPSGQVYIHPDGSRLLWSAGGQLQIFDLTVRKVTSQFSFGLPSTIAASAAMSMSQDGGRVYVSDALGDVVVLDTNDGEVLQTFNTGASTSVFGGPPSN